MGVDDAGEAHPSVGQFLDHPDVSEQVQAKAAVGLGDRDPEEAEVSHLVDDRGGKSVAPFQVGGDRDDLSSDEFPHQLDDLGPDCFVHVLRVRSGHASTSFFAAKTIHFAGVDAESQFGEDCFPMTPGLMHRGLESAAIRFPDHPAVLAGPACWTFADLDRAAASVARALVDRGIRPGDRLAMMTSNRPEFVAVVHGASKVGVAPVLLNPAWKGLEVDAALRLTAPRYAVADGTGAALLRANAWADSSPGPGRPGRGPRRRPRL